VADTFVSKASPKTNYGAGGVAGRGCAERPPQPSQVRRQGTHLTSLVSVALTSDQATLLASRGVLARASRVVVETGTPTPPQHHSAVGDVDAAGERQHDKQDHVDVRRRRPYCYR
jgi:hypothetical protein